MAENLFGPGADTPRTDTPPAGLEGVHQEGDYWAKTGDTYNETTRFKEDLPNLFMGMARALRTGVVNVDDLAPNDPFLLRTFLERYIAATQSTSLAAYVAANPSEISTIIEAALLTAGLPNRLAASSVVVADWDDAEDNGWYVGTDATNAPSGGGVPTGLYVGRVIKQDNDNILQILTAMDSGSPIPESYMRKKDTTWEAWTSANPAGLVLGDLDGLFIPGDVASENGGDLKFEKLWATHGELVSRALVGEDAELLLTDETDVVRALVSWLRASDSFSVGRQGSSAPLIQNASDEWKIGNNRVVDIGLRPDGSLALANGGTNTDLRTWAANHIKAAVDTHGRKFEEIATWTHSSNVAEVDFSVDGYAQVALMIRNMTFSGNSNVRLTFKNAGDVIRQLTWWGFWDSGSSDAFSDYVSAGNAGTNNTVNLVADINSVDTGSPFFGQTVMLDGGFVEALGFRETTGAADPIKTITVGGDGSLITGGFISLWGMKA